MYVIKLKSCNSRFDESANLYGYWMGTAYAYQKTWFPYCENKITEKTKRYKHKKAAINAAEKCIIKFSYVLAYEIEEVPDLLW